MVLLCYQPSKISKFFGFTSQQFSFGYSQSKSQLSKNNVTKLHKKVLLCYQQSTISKLFVLTLKGLGSSKLSRYQNTLLSKQIDSSKLTGEKQIMRIILSNVSYQFLEVFKYDETKTQFLWEIAILECNTRGYLNDVYWGFLISQSIVLLPFVLRQCSNILN